MKESQDDNDGLACRDDSSLTTELAEIRKLKVQVKQLEMEKRILNEAMVFFAKETT